MHIQLEGKVVVITGSTAGIGKEIAKIVAKEGAITIVNGRSSKTVAATVQELKEKTGSLTIYGVAADVSSPEGIESFILQVADLNLPPVYALVNNTGIFESKPFTEIGDDEWTTFFQTNVMSGVKLSKAFLPTMLDRNEGTILFVSSEAALAPKGFMIHYSMTKAAQLSISRGLAEVTKGTKVRINSILPGPTMTEGVEKYMQGIAKEQGISVDQATKDYFSTMEPTSLLQRFERPEEIANVAAFMISPLSSAVTGRSWLVDGGIIRHI